MKRKEANLAILAQITHYVTMNPDMRFGQALRNMGVIMDYRIVDEKGEFTGVGWMNHFNEESTSILKRVKETKKKEKLT